jgi:hypothetical protein
MQSADTDSFSDNPFVGCALPRDAREALSRVISQGTRTGLELLGISDLYNVSGGGDVIGPANMGPMSTDQCRQAMDAMLVSGRVICRAIDENPALSGYDKITIKTPQFYRS